MEYINKLIKILGDKGMFIILTIMFLIAMGIIIYPNNKNTGNKGYVNNTESSHSETEAEQRIKSQNRAKKYNEIYDKYEKLIKQNRRNPIKAIEILEDQGFSLTNTVQFPGGLIAYSYTKYTDGFNVEVIYSDSPNPQFNEVVMGTITDTQLK